jgi:hypothetical protein
MKDYTAEAQKGLLNRLIEKGVKGKAQENASLHYLAGYRQALRDAGESDAAYNLGWWIQNRLCWKNAEQSVQKFVEAEVENLTEAKA